MLSEKQRVGTIVTVRMKINYSPYKCLFFLFFFLHVFVLEMKRRKMVIYRCRFFLRKSTALSHRVLQSHLTFRALFFPFESAAAP